MPPSRVEPIIDDWQAHGRYVFTRDDLRAEIGKWDTATRDALRRLTKDARLARPRVGFYVIVPLEYRSAGSPPASWFVDPLMAYLGQPYYVGLLTAASLHGAAHHRPQEFQVLTDRPTRVARAGRVRIRFVVNSSIGHTTVESIKTVTGSMRVSTPEATAFDLVRHVDAAGGYDNVAGVLAGLAERIDSGELAEQADRVPSVVARRTGYLLETAGAGQVARALAERFSGTDVEPQPLEPGRSKRGAQRDDRWGLYVNTIVEPEPS
ncbi:type IV toxin-antitoxin system AbiEi family antitoxin [soil metagenome]